jgi:YVTN family beta-propeller protein
MEQRVRLLVVVLLVVCLALGLIYPGLAEQGRLLAALLLNGDFEGSFYPYGSGYVAEYWVPYDFLLGASPPQFLRSTLHQHDGQASQQIWADNMAWYAGIMQTTLLTSQSGARIQAGRRYTVHVWAYSIYRGAGSAVQNDKILKRVGIHPGGGVNPQSSAIVWTPWHGQDKVWVQINAAVEASGDRLTVFVEAKVEESAGQDQLYIDGVWLEEEGAPTPTRTPTRTPTATATPVPTATPAIAVLRSVAVGSRPQGVGVLPSSNRFFVANRGDDTVSSLEGFFDWRHTTLPSGGHDPANVAVDADQCRMYVANSTSDSVTVFNICANRPIGSVDLGSGQAPDGLAVLTTTNTIYVANSGADSVAVIDGDTLSVRSRIPAGPRPAQVAVNSDTEKVYVANRGNVPAGPGSVTVIDAASETVIRTLDLSSVDAAAEPHSVAVNVVTNRVYVALPSGQLVIIDGTSDQVLLAVPSPDSTGFDAVAVNPVTNNVFVSSSTGNSVFVYDADMSRWIRTLAVGAGWPRGIAVNPLTYQAVVSNPDANTASVIRDHGVYQPLKVYMPIARKQ